MCGQKTTAALVLSLVLTIVSAFPALAEGKSSSTARYDLKKSGDGYMRLDRQTGEMNYCTIITDNLVCTVGADERQAYLDEMNLLADKISKLETELKSIASGDRNLNDTVKRNEPSGTKSDKEITNLDEELNKALEFTQDAMRKFFGAVKELKEKYQKDGI